MAQAKILEVDTGNAQKSLKDLRNEINQLKESLYGLNENTEEYALTALKLGYAQEELNAYNMKTRDGINALSGSYNALSYEMSQLKVEFKATNDEAKRDELSKRIYEINDRLKEMDESVGVYGRNVGNYTKSMQEAFQNVGLTIGNINPLFQNLADGMVKAGSKGGSAFTALGTSAKGLGTQLKALIANPVGAVIMAIVIAVKAAKAIFDKFKESVNRNEEASNNLKIAMAPIQAIVNGITEVFDNFVETLTKGASAVGQFVSEMMKMAGLSSDRVEDENKIAQMQIDNAKLKRQYTEENAKLDLEASEARAKAAEKDKYSNKERIAFLQEYKDKQDLIAKNNLDLAQKQLEALELEAAQGKNDAEMNDRIAEAKANVYRVQLAYNDKLRETSAQMAEINNQIKAEEQAEKKAAEEKAKKYREEINKLKEAYKSTLKSLNDALFGDDMTYKISVLQEELKKQVSDLDTAYKKHAITRAQYNEAIYKSEQALTLKIQKLKDELVKAAKDYENSFIQAYGSDLEKTENQVLKAQEDALKALQDAFDKDLVSEELFYTKQLKIRDFYANEMKAKKDESVSKEIQDRIAAEETAADIIYNYDIAMNKMALQNREVSAAEYLQKDLQMTIDRNEQAMQMQMNAKTEFDNMLASGDITYEAYADRVMEIETEILNLRLQNEQLVQEQKNANIDEYITSLSSSLDTLANAADSITSIGDGISSAWSGVFDTLNQGIIDVGESLKSGEKGWKSYSKIAVSALSTASSIMLALADEQDTNTKEGFEQLKKYQIAAVAMNMLSGIANAWVSAMSPENAWMTVWGQLAMGTAMSALIGTMGALQISKIKQTQFEGGDTSSSSGSSSSVTPSISSLSDIVSPVQYTSNVEGVELSQNVADNRVYVLENDIAETSNKVRVAQSENIF